MLSSNFVPNLPTDLVTQIVGYLPFKKVQLINDSGYRFNNNILINLLKLVYKVNDDIIKTLFITNPNPPLTSFDLYCHIVMLIGNSGYNGQLYLPPYVCLLYAIKNGDIELINYYFLRYYSNWQQMLIDIEWSMPFNRFDKTGYDSFTMFMLTISKDKYTYTYLINLLNKYNKNGLDTCLKMKSLVDSDDYDNDEVEGFYDNEETEGTHKYSYMTAFKRLDSTDAIELILSDVRIRDINPHIIADFIRFSTGYITKQNINNAKLILASLNTVETGNYGEGYKNLLKILTGEEPNHIKYINKGSNVGGYWVTLAFAVMNSKIINKLIELEVNCTIDPLASEVLYDITILNKLINSNIYNSSISNFIQTATTLSLYLSNLALYSNITNNKINMITTLVNKYNIIDPETALRLSYVTNVKPYLKPANEFDKNLMAQFGLL